MIWAKRGDLARVGSLPYNRCWNVAWWMGNLHDSADFLKIALEQLSQICDTMAAKNLAA
jgi:hypothetical protein